ncbi:tRNA (adenosine(37)-N6)-dimethylallyltransferase MiaA [Tropicimonas sp. IMCC34043]|uniref:tRNA (adenosine(37)-N6)-dimethylallyltransferase MiaA n=1 Tax=Tropicimonas sp. IMCC34043 TaxID=2248760 RepID=UPI000E288095|nr:tRNA (adenosine(37)-N6)-dimethylallyltransferase MiaA [Tropicimonas sp. IMCC34043]
MISLHGIPDARIDRERPILIAGPTASGKSGLALRIAEAMGGVIVNADALQVFENWRILTARPSPEDEARAAHRLYGHVARDQVYSVGHWLRDLTPLLNGPDRPIIVGGTGLYFTALTSGLVEIPPVPANVRAEADAMTLHDLLTGLDQPTRTRIDTANRARVQRAWEVQRATGRGLADWQADTPAPLLPEAAALCLVMEAPKDWLSPRIDRRFDAMITAGALDEARANLPGWSPGAPSAKAIGAPELIAHLKGETSLEAAAAAAKTASRQYAKRQRTWFRARMAGWQRIAPAD